MVNHCAWLIAKIDCVVYSNYTITDASAAQQTNWDGFPAKLASSFHQKSYPIHTILHKPMLVLAALSQG